MLHAVRVISPACCAGKAAGFCDFRVHPIELGPDPRAGDDRAYWADILRNPLAILIDCVRS